MDTEGEIIRLRQRVHDLTGERKAILYRLGEVEKATHDLRGQVEALVKADEIADAVTAALAEREENKSTSEKLGLTKAQLRWAIVFGVASVGLNIAGTAHTIFGL